jgi:two-component system, cell cycle sensor histidine kinase DivJ
VLGKEGVRGLIAYFLALVHDSARAGAPEPYRLLAESAPDMLTRHDERGRVVFASAAAEPLFGEPAERIAGDGLFDRVHVADRPLYLTALSRALADNEQVAVAFRIRRSGPAGAAEYVWVEMRCRPVGVSEGREPGQTCVIAVTRDISDRKAREAELVRARDAAEDASRAKTEFLANMSHELRTPLNAVIGFSDILSRELFGTFSEARYRDYARLIHESSAHLLNVVDDILDMSKMEAGKFRIVKEPVDVGALVELCCDIMRPAAVERSLSLIADFAPDVPALPADKTTCKQMLLNLIANAIKFTEPGGFVRVSARVSGANLELSVADNGIGIAEQDLPRLGKPFVQASNAYGDGREGTGLGLAVVSGLARLHGGRLELDSALGKGTTATIFLPYDETGEAREAPSKRPSVSAA